MEDVLMNEDDEEDKGDAVVDVVADVVDGVVLMNETPLPNVCDDGISMGFPMGIVSPLATSPLPMEVFQCPQKCCCSLFFLLS